MIDKALLDRHNLTDDEYRLIVELLGREPNLPSSACSRSCGPSTAATRARASTSRRSRPRAARVVQGPGENAGVVDIGDGLAVAFKIESHNHPSAIEPYQGAATGVGGILRDIFTMGARPIAAHELAALRPARRARRTAAVIEGVVAGIAGYGNCVGVPTVGGEVVFDDCYSGNPLVNALCLGLADKDEIFYGHGRGRRQPGPLRRAPRPAATASTAPRWPRPSSTRRPSDKRPTVQVGDPFMEKLLLEACLELMRPAASSSASRTWAPPA